MLNILEPFTDSLGNEPLEIFGISSEEELEIILAPLMEVVTKDGIKSME